MGNIEVTSETAENIVANFNFSISNAEVAIDTTYYLKDGYQQFSGKLNSI